MMMLRPPGEASDALRVLAQRVPYARATKGLLPRLADEHLVVFNPQTGVVTITVVDEANRAAHEYEVDITTVPGPDDAVTAARRAVMAAFN